MKGAVAMKLGVVRSISFGVIGTASILGMCFFSCGGPTAPSNPGVSLSSLVVTNQISGWAPTGNPVYFVDTSIYNLVDGGSSTYCGTCTNDTLKEGFLSYMSKVPQGTDTEQLKMFVVQYTTSAAVAKIFSGIRWEVRLRRVRFSALFDFPGLVHKQRLSYSRLRSL